MFSPENDLRRVKRPRANFHGGDTSEAAFFNSIDFPESLEGLSDALVSALEDNVFADYMLPALFDGSPDGTAKLSSSPGEAAIHGALRTTPSLHSSPTLPASLAASVPLPAAPSRRSAGVASHDVPALASMLDPATARAIQTSGNYTVNPNTSGAFIPTPAVATTNVTVSQLTAITGLTRSPSSSSPQVPPSRLLGSTGPGVDTRASQPSGSGLGSPGPTGRTGVGTGYAKLGSGSASGLGSSLRSGAEVHGSGGSCTAQPSNTQGASKSTVMAAGAGRNGGKATGFSGWSHSGLDGEDEDDEGLAADRRVRASLGQRAVMTNPAAAAGTGGGGGSLLLRVFKGAMRPEVAALAAAAAQRALVVSSSVPPGLYFTEPEQGGAGRAGSARSLKRGGKDKQGLPTSSSVLTPTALPFAKYYPEADAELMAALNSKRQLPRRVRVETITDRCHPCFRNPFEGLASVKERRKLVATGPLHEGCLLGAYTGELRSGKMDERLVGGDLSGAEGLKAAFTLTLLEDLETRATEQEVSSQAVAPSRDSLVIVGDPSVCPLAEANAPRFWGSCSTLKPGSIGEGDRAACNCRTYKGLANNAAVIPCVLKIRLSRLKAILDAACGGCLTEELTRGFEVLRTASAAVSAPAAGSVGMSGGAHAAAAGGAAGAAAAPLMTSGSSSARSGAGGGGGPHASTAAAPGTLMASAGAGSSSDDQDKLTFVYGIVTVVVTSNAIKEGEEVLLRWDSDDSFFAVADQNLKQYLYIRSLMTERDTAEAKVNEHRRQLALLRKAHRESQAAREVARQRRDEAIQRKEEVERSLEEVIRQRDEAVEDGKGQRAAAAALAAADGPRVARLEAQVKQLLADREALQAQLEQLRDQRPGAQYQRYAQCLQGQQGNSQQDGQAMQKHHNQTSLEEVDQREGRHRQQQQQQQHGEVMGLSAANTLRCSGEGSNPTRHVAVEPPGVSELLSKHANGPQRLQRPDRDHDDYGLEHEGLHTTHSRQPNDAAAGGVGGTVTENGLSGQPSIGGSAEDGDGLDPGGWPALLLQRYAEAKLQHDAMAAEVVAALGQREGASWKRAAQLEAQLADACHQLEAARGRAEEASARLEEVQQELVATRLRLEQQLVSNGGSSAGPANNGNH